MNGPLEPPEPADVLNQVAASAPDDVVVIIRRGDKLYVVASTYPDEALDMLAEVASTILAPFVEADQRALRH